MAGPTRKQIAAQFNTALWLKWQAQRRNPNYRSAVAQFLCDLRRDIGDLTAQRQGLQMMGMAWDPSQLANLDPFIESDAALSNRLDASRRVLLTYQHIKRHLRQFEGGLTPAERQALTHSAGNTYAEINHTVMTVIAPCLAQDILDQVPPLARFCAQWTLRFPLPPRLPWVILEAFRDTMPIRVVSVDDARHTLLIEAKFDTDFPMQVVTDFFELYYAAYSPRHRSRWESASARRLQPLEHYLDVFRVHDLRKRRWSFAKIAKHLWPKDFAQGQRAYPGKNPAIQRAQDHSESAENLIPSM